MNKVRRYTVEEWSKFKVTEQMALLDLAPEHIESKSRQILTQALMPLTEMVAAQSNRITSILAFIESQGEVLDTEGMIKAIDSFELDSYDILELVYTCQQKYTDEKSRIAKEKHKPDTWKAAVLEQYCERQHEFKSLEGFCDDVAGAAMVTKNGHTVTAPKRETIKKMLTKRAIDIYKRRNGIS